jgi:cell division transport system permease protein
MKLFRMIKNGVRDAFKSVYRNFSLSIASISCISITLIVVSLALLVAFNVENFSNKAGDNVTIVTYLKLGVTEEDIKEFEESIDKMENVSKGWAKQTPAQRKQALIDEDDFFSSVGTLIENENEVFHYRYDINVKDIKKIDDTKKDLLANEIVEKAEYGDETISRMINLFDFAGKLSIVVAIVLMVVTSFLIINTIKLTISARSREISIMRLVGASNITIKLPFIIEGMILGIIGSIIPILFATYGYIAFYNHFDGHLYSEVIKLVSPYPFIYQSALIVLIIGIIVGMIGSAGAVRRYLKV